MKIAILLGLSLLFVGCTSFEVRRESTAELRGRYAQAERELAAYHAEENDRGRLSRFRDLTQQQHSVERELFRRCRAGDSNACLPHFHLIAADL
jgi:hypothetical protein